MKNLGQARAKAQKTSFLRDESGATAMIVACMFTLLLAVLGALIDTARLTLAQNKLQASLDAAALAAAREANTVNMQQEATKFFNANFPTNYMGMSPAAISVSQSGNQYIFTTSSPLPYSIMSASGGSGIITVQAKITTGSGGSQGAELALILDNSSAMGQNTSGGVTRISVLKSAVSTLMDRIATSNAHISMVNFNNAIRVSTTDSTASPTSWMTTPPSTTAGSFSEQTSMSNSGRFDGCLSTKSQEVNNTYPQSNSAYYLMNDDENPTVGGKYRQYMGPVDYNSYNSPLLYDDYYFKQVNTNDGTVRDALIVAHNYVNGQSYTYSGTSPPASSGLTPTPYGLLGVRDDFNSTYTYSVSGGGLTPSTATHKYIINNEFDTATGEAQPHSPTGSINTLLYTRVTPVNYDDPVAGSVVAPFQLQRSYTKPNTSWSVGSSWGFKRTLSLGDRYAYAFKVYMGYRPATSVTMSWVATNEAGAVVTSGAVTPVATTGSMATKDKYVVDIFIPLAYRPAFQIYFYYPGLYIPTTTCDSTSGNYAYCKEVRKTSTSSTFSVCKQCSPSGCGTNTPNSSSCFGLNASDYSTYNWFYALGEPGPIVAYPTCGTLANSLFMKTSAATIKTASSSLVATGPARVNIGLNWGWRTLSPKWSGLFNNTESSYPQPYSSGQNKIAVLITQGDSFRNKAKTENANDGSYFDDNSFNTLCTNMKNKGIKLYVIGVGVTNPATVARLQSCATDNDNDPNTPASANNVYYANWNTNSDTTAITNRIADAVATNGAGSIQFQ